jgi:hypothetical protein
VLLIAASILAARKLAQYDVGKRVPATVAAITLRLAQPLSDGVSSQARGFPHGSLLLDCL